MPIDKTMQKSLTKALKSGSSNQLNFAFEKIFQEYSGLIYHIVLTIIQNKDTAEDIVMDTFTKFFENIPNLDPTRNFKYWLTTTAKHLAIDSYNKKNVRTVSMDEDTVISELITDQSSPWKELLNELSSVLSENEIDVLSLHLIYRMSFREISEYKGVTIHSISSLYRRSLMKLKNYYKDGNLE